MGSVPMSGVSIFGGPLIGTSGPFTQQHAGRRSSKRRMDVVVVTSAIGFQGTERDICKADLSQRVPGGIGGWVSVLSLGLVRAFNSERTLPHPLPASHLIKGWLRDDDFVEAVQEHPQTIHRSNLANLFR